MGYVAGLQVVVNELRVAGFGAVDGADAVHASLRFGGDVPGPLNRWLVCAAVWRKEKW